LTGYNFIKNKDVLLEQNFIFNLRIIFNITKNGNLKKVLFKTWLCIATIGHFQTIYDLQRVNFLSFFSRFNYCKIYTLYIYLSKIDDFVNG